MMIIIVTKCLTEAHRPTEKRSREQGGSLAEPGLVWDGWVQKPSCHAAPVPANQKKFIYFPNKFNEKLLYW